MHQTKVVAFTQFFQLRVERESDPRINLHIKYTRPTLLMVLQPHPRIPKAAKARNALSWVLHLYYMKKKT